MVIILDQILNLQKITIMLLVMKMDVKNTAEKRIYDKQKFYYIVSEFGQSTVADVGAGGTVSSGTNYGTAGGQMTYFYKIYSCAVGGDNNQKAMVEVIVGVVS